MVHFHHRYQADGSCETVCTRCFETVGRAEDITQLRRLEQQHVCPRTLAAGSVGPGQRTGSRRQWLSLAAALLLTVLLSYAVPTLMELIDRSQQSAVLIGIFFGDAAGCLMLGLLLGCGRSALVLYAGAAVLKSLLYELGFITAGQLLWLADLAPTLANAGVLLYRSRRPPPRSMRA